MRLFYSGRIELPEIVTALNAAGVNDETPEGRLPEIVEAGCPGCRCLLSDNGSLLVYGPGAWRELGPFDQGGVLAPDGSRWVERGAMV